MRPQAQIDEIPGLVEAHRARPRRRLARQLAQRFLGARGLGRWPRRPVLPDSL